VGFEGTTAKIRERQKAGDFAGMASVISDDLLDHFVVRGTWDELAARIVARLEGVATSAIIYSAGMAWMQDAGALTQWGEVARAVRSATA